MSQQTESAQQFPIHWFTNTDPPFYVGRYFHDADDFPPLHYHDFVELIYVVSGRARHSFEGELYDIEPGDVFIINPGETHMFHIPDGEQLEIINCLFPPDIIDDALLRELDISNSIDYFYVQPFLSAEERFHHELRLYGEDAHYVLQLLEGMITEMKAHHRSFATMVKLKLVELLIVLSRLYEKYRRSHGGYKPDDGLMVRRICGFLERNAHRKVRLTTIADLFGISERHLHRLFKNQLGLSVIQFIQQVRLEKAKKLLVDTDEKVITVALLVGYDDPAFFSRLFSREIGCSPSQYRKTARHCQGVEKD